MKSEIKSRVEGNLQKVGFIILVLFSIHFWNLKYIPQKFNLENLLTWMVCAYCFIVVYKNKNLHFRNAIILFLFGIFLNIFTAKINYGQRPYDTVLAFAYEYFILIYFLLHQFKLNPKFLENTIIIFAIIYTLIYIVQAEVFPYKILTSGLYLDRGKFQFEIIGHGFLMLAYFLMLNRFILKRKIGDLIFIIIFFIVLLMMNFRTLIAGALLVTLIFIVRSIKFNARNLGILIIITLLFVILFQFPKYSQMLSDFVTDTEQNISQKDNYIRLRQFEYFFKEYPQNFSYFIFGGGKSGGNNIYNLNMTSLGMNYNIVWVDLGLLGYYIVVGAVSLAGMLWYTIKAISTKLPLNKLYLNYYFFYLLIVSFTNQEIFRSGIFTVQAIGLYLIDISINKTQNSANGIDFTDNQ